MRRYRFPHRVAKRQEDATMRQKLRNERGDDLQLAVVETINPNCREAKRLRAKIEKAAK